MSILSWGVSFSGRAVDDDRCLRFNISICHIELVEMQTNKTNITSQPPLSFDPVWTGLAGSG